MSMRDEGYALFAPGDALLEFTVVDLENNIRDSVFCPRDYEILTICRKYGIDVDAVCEIIQNKDKDVHTMVIDVNKFREYLESRRG